MSLSSIYGPGYAGYMEGANSVRQKDQQNLQTATGLMSLLQRQKALEQEAQMQPLRVQEIQSRIQERTRADELNKNLPNLVQAATNPDGSLDYGKLSGALMSTPGGAQLGMNMRKAEEDRKARVQMAVDANADRMERLAMQLGMQDQWKRMDDSTKRMLAQQALEGRMTLAQMTKSMRDAVSGDGRREPFRFSVGGKDIQGWRDKYGNVFLPDGKATTDYGPALTPADRKANADLQKQELRDESVQSRIGLVIGKVDEALKLVGPMTAGFIGGNVSRIKGTPAYDLDRIVDTIKANIGFQELQAMRDASPTGGALGQVAVKELDMLQATLSSIDTGQSPAQLRKGLESIKRHYQNWAKIMQKHNAKSPPQPVVPTQNQPTGFPSAADIDAEIARRQRGSNGSF